MQFLLPFNIKSRFGVKFSNLWSKSGSASCFVWPDQLDSMSCLIFFLILIKSVAICFT